MSKGGMDRFDPIPKSFIAILFVLLIFSLGSTAMAAGQTPQKELSDTVEVLCPILAGESSNLNPFEADVLARCGEVKRRGGQSFESLSDEQKNGLDNMTSEESSAMGTTTVEMAGGQQAIITQRLTSLRPAISGGVASLQPTQRPVSVLLASTDPSIPVSDSTSGSALGGRLGFYVNGSFSTGDKDATSREPGFDFDNQGITIGADYRVSDALVLGAAVGYSRTEADIANAAGNTEADGLGGSLYGGLNFDRFYLDAIGTVGTKDYKTQRNVDYAIGSTSVKETFLGEADATEFGFSLGGGYDLPMGALSITPFARANYLKSKIDGYTEQAANPASTAPGFGLALQVGDQSITSLNTELGVSAAYAWSTSWGVVSPNIRANWTHEFDNDARNLSARFVNGGTSANATAANFILIPTDSPDRDYVNFGAGLSMVLARGWMFFIDYATVFGLSDISLHQASGGLRLEF